MTGTAPTVALSVTPTGTVAPGTQLVATLTVTDPDTTTEALSSTDSLGRTDTVTIARVDPESVVWALDGLQLLPSADGTVGFPAPNGSATLTATVTDGQGNVATATYAVTVQAPTLIGDAYALDLGDFPRDAFGILFNGPGKGVNTKAIAAFPANVLLLVAVKDTITPSMLAAIVAARGPHPLWLCWHQEPEGDLASTDYIAGQKALAALIATLPKAQRDLITQVGKLTEWAEQHGKGPYTAWWAGVEKIMCIDGYAAAPAGNAYITPEVMWAGPLSWATAAGVKMAVTEFGLVQAVWDKDGSALAAAIVAHVKYLRLMGVLVVAWWDGKGTNNDYTLTGKALAAWQAAVAGQ